ncbi:MAG: hypothetical protein Q8876_10015, partial [Bacillota bacterium]|nr:hypothetical protein [Bacillota bacterium]
SEAVRSDKQKQADLAAQMEKIFEDQVLNVPVFEPESYTMFSDRTKLAVKTNLPGINWGIGYIDIVK